MPVGWLHRVGSHCFRRHFNGKMLIHPARGRYVPGGAGARPRGRESDGGHDDDDDADRCCICLEGVRQAFRLYKLCLSFSLS